MDVSVILVNYNTKQLTLDCLKSVYEKTSDIKFEIFVVDNASSDGSVEAIKNAFPQVKVIESPVNLGFGRANNLGIRQSSGKYVFLLNTDTILINNAIKILFDFMEKTPTAGACGGNLFDKDMNYVHSHGFLKTPKSHFLRLLGLRYLDKKLKNDLNRDQLQQVEQIIGADLMLRKEVLDKTGIFDERFFLYCEESELQFRIKKSGSDIFYIPDAKIFHLEGATTRRNSKFRRQQISQSEYLYLSLCFNNIPKLFLRILCSLPILYRIFTAPTYTFKSLKYIWTN